MYIFDAFLKEGGEFKNREEFNYWTAKQFVRQSTDKKPKLNEVFLIYGLPRPYKVICFSCHRHSEFEPVIDVIKLR